MPDVFLEKMIQASHTLLNVTRELKRNAMLNDFESRNSQVGKAHVWNAAGWPNTMKNDVIVHGARF